MRTSEELKKREPMRMYVKVALLAALIACFYVAFIAIRTNFGLLVGGDFPGYYDWRYPIHYAPYVPDLIYSLGLLLSNNNFYAGFYFYLIINIFISVFAVGLLAAEVMYKVSNERNEHIVLLAATVIMLYYVSQPLLYVNTFKSILKGLVWIQYTAAYSLLLIALLRIEEGVLKPLFLALIATILGPLSLPFPNDVRLGALYVLTLLIYLTLLLVEHNTKYTRRIIMLVVISLPILFMKALEVLAKKQVIVTYSKLHDLQIPRPLKGMSLIDVFILASAWTRYTKFCPYCSNYFNGSVTVLNALLVALAFALLLGSIRRIRKNARTYVLLLLILYVLAVFHESRGLLAPGLYSFIYSRLPLASIFSYAAILGPVAARHAYQAILAAALSIASKYRQKHVFIVLVLTLVAASMVSLRPLLDGSALSLFADPKVHGVHIPREYCDVKHFLRENNLDTVIILPQMRTYIYEKWGYQGTQKFYYSFFYPIHVIYIGNYGEYINTNYYNLTTIRVHSARTVRIDNFTVLHYSGRILIGLPREYKMSPNLTVIVNLKLSAGCSIERIGLGNKKDVAWYLPYRGGLYIEKIGEIVSARIVAGLYNKPWPASRLPQNISKIYVVLKGACQHPPPQVESVNIGRVSGLDKAYLDELRQRGIKALIVDKGVVQGNMTLPTITDRIIASSGIRILMRNRFLTIYGLVDNESQRS